MAFQTGVRFKPDTYKSQLEAIIMGFDPTSTPPTGTRVFPVQIVAYNDARFNVANYDAGDPATEKRLRVLYTETIQVEIAPWATMTINQIEADLNARLDAWALSVKPALALLNKINTAIERVGLRPIP